MYRWFQGILETHMRHIVAHFYRVIVAVSVVVTALSVWVIATQWNMNSDLNALLPESSPASIAMREVSGRVGSGSSLFVVVDSPDKQANLAFAEAYTAELRKNPKIALAHYHNDKTFFSKHQLLYMSPEDLKELTERVQGTIRQAKKEANPLFVPLRPSKDKAELEVDDLKHKYERKMAHKDYREYLFSEDGYALTIIVRFVESSTDLRSTNTLINRVRDLASELEPTSYHPEMTVDFGGGLANRQKQYNSIVEDIQTSAGFTLVGLLLVLGLYFRRARAVLVVLTPLVMGVAWTLATAFLIYGELNAITVFIFAILLGLGIDFSIHLLHGYDRARKAGKDPVPALVDCAQGTGLATVVGAATTFATFLVLTLADFKSLSEFGVVASIGVVMTLVATLATMPALVLTLQDIMPWTPKVTDDAQGGDHVRPSVAFLRKWLGRLAPAALILAAVVTVGAGLSAKNIGFEENFYRIGRFYWPWEEKPNMERRERLRGTKVQGHDVAESIARSAEAMRERIDPESYVRKREQETTGQKYASAMQNKTSSSPTILLFDDAEQAEEIAFQAQRRLSADTPPSIASIQSIYAFMPGTAAEQAERMKEIRELRAILGKESLSFLDKDQRKRIEDLRDKLDVEPVMIRDLPEWTKRFFKEAGPKAHPPADGEDFAYEYLIIATPRQSELNGPQARKYLKDLREVVGTQEEGDFKLASQAYVYTTMLDEIQTDGLRMISIALAVVLVLLTLGFRSLRKALLALTPLAVGAVWTFGLASLLTMKLDFFNIIILPALIGIGIDDGVHFTMRYLELGKDSLPEVIRDIGAAVTMTSITSMIGFGGLAITNYRGLQSLGQLAVVGILSAWLATLVVLPALLWLGERIRVHRA